MNKNIVIKTKEKKYSIEIKSNSLIRKLKKIIKQENKVFIIIDKKVNHLIKLLLNCKNLEVLTINASEKIKSFDHYKNITEKIISKGVDRNSIIIGIGGGTIGDLSGFISSTILRGVKFILIPTTLLSQVDSAIGGKNGINSIHGKNLIGTFYQPDLVIIDPKVLQSLSKREVKSGYAEIIKHAIINDFNFFRWLDENFKKILDLDLKTLDKVICKSIIIKSKFVTADTKEMFKNNKSRSILNFGHTFGHALETFYQYNKKYTHGEAISIGMIIACKISYKYGYLSLIDFEKIQKHFNKVGLPIHDKNMYNSKILELIKKDKKNIKDNINLVLIKKIGNAVFCRNLNIKKIKKYIY